MSLFGLSVGIGASLGVLLVVRAAPPARQLAWALCGLATLAAALVGARLLYVGLHPAFYAGEPLLKTLFSPDGLSWPGGLAAALLIGGLAAPILRAPLAVTADRLAPLFILLSAMTWLGCALTGCAYGNELGEIYPWALPVVDMFGELTYRWPLQYIAAGSLLLAVAWVEGVTQGARQAGVRACLNGLVLGLHSLLFSYWRADPTPQINGLRLDYAAAIGLCALSVLGMLGIALLRLGPSLKEARSEI